MDIDLARHLIRTALRTTRELTEALDLAKRALPADEYRRFGQQIAGAIQTVHGVLIDRAVAAHPALEAEVEASIARYDRYL